MANWRLRSVRVLTFEGIGPNASAVELDELSPGINLLWAPNRRGKSCTARAISAAMANNRTAAPGSSVILSFGVDEGPENRFTYNSQARGLPDELPTGFVSSAARYQLALYDLLLAPGTELAQALLEELYGGVNLDKIAVDLGLGKNPQGYTVPAETYGRAYKRFDKLSSEHEEVRRKSEMLSPVRDELQQVQEKLRVGGHLQLVREYLAAGDALEIALARLHEYPDEDRVILKKLGINSPRLFQARIQAWEGLKKRIEKCEDEIKANQENLYKNRFGTDSELPETTQLERLEENCAILQEAATDVKNAREALTEQQQLVATAERKAKNATDAAEAVRASESSWPDDAALDRAEDARRDAETLVKEADELKLGRAGARKERSDALARSTSILPEAIVEAWLERNVVAPQISDATNAYQRQQAAAIALAETKEDLREVGGKVESQGRAGEAAAEAVPILRNWLDSFEPGESRADEGGGNWLSYALPAVAIVFAILLAVMVHPGFWATVVIALVMTVLSSMKSKPDARYAVANPPVPLPDGVKVDSWTFGDVHQVLAAQQEIAAAWRALQRRSAVLEERYSERKKKLYAEDAQAKAAVAALVDNIGESAAEVDPSQIDDLVSNLRALRTAADAYSQLNWKIEELTRQLDAKLREAREAVPYLAKIDQPSDPAAIKTSLTRIKERCAKLAELETSAADLDVKVEEALDKRDELRNALKTFETTYEQVVKDLRKAFAVWTSGAEVAGLDSAGEFRALLGKLRTDAQDCRTSRDERTNTEETLKGLRSDLAEAAQEVDRWFTDYGFPGGIENWPENRRRLESLEGELDEFKDVQREVEDAARDERALLAKLDSSEVPEELRKLKTLELERREAELHELKARETSLQEKITETNTLVDQLCDASALEEADAEVEETLDAVRVMRRRVIVAKAGGRVLERLKQRFLRDNSTTLNEASRLLNKFSGGSYELDLATTRPPKLVAKHVARREKGGGQSLTELSSNTRVQSLMAARLAFLHTQEREWGGMRLPLIVDEALAIADPEGSHSVMEALAREAQAGRQILYFTAQPNEIRQWQTFFAEPGSAGYPQPIIHDGLGKGTELLAEAVTANWAPTPLPEPADGEGLDEYLRRLSVPILDPWMEDPVTAAHVCYLVDDDPKQLHQLATCCRTIGELNAWLTRLGEDLQPLQVRLAREDCGALVEVWGGREAILRDVVGLWRQGRVPKLTPDVLRQTANIGGAWEERANQIIKTVNGDPVEFLKKFEELPRMRQKTADEIKERLRDNELLPKGAPLGQNDVYRELLRRYPEAEQEVRLVFPRLQHLWPPE